MTPPSPVRTTLAGLALAALLAGCSSGTPAPAPAPAPPAASAPSGAATSAGSTITMMNFAFGTPLTVKPGETVTIANSDSAPHNVTAADGSFKTQNITKGQTATFVAPSKPGSYPFTCTVHPNMHGMLIVAP